MHNEIATTATFPGRGSWFSIDAALRRAFVSCPDLGRMTTALTQLQHDAQHEPGPVWIVDTSFVHPGARLHLGLSIDRDAPALFPDAPRPCWHLSISEGSPAIAASDAEVLGWVMAGFPAASEVAVYTMATGAARHAEIPMT